MKLSNIIEIYGDIEIECDEVKAWIIEQTDEAWEPQYREDFYYVDYRGVTVKEHHRGDTLSQALISRNKVFKYAEQCDFYEHKNRFLIGMERDFASSSERIDWNNTEQKKYCFAIDLASGKIVIGEAQSYMHYGFYTTDKAWLEQYIQGDEERIKAYYFGGYKK